ncbi:hypothetical protein MK079_02315 [Candidatus Gracilibacteria bacterium]|nr:hypothetical protein [Candidatus Gracilibacteria bacterium]
MADTKQKSDSGTTQKETFSSQNIFDEFAQTPEIEEQIKETNKDMYYYFQKIITCLQVFVLLSLCVFVLLAGYITLQKNEALKQSSLLDPLCMLFVSDIPQEGLCSSISFLHDDYKNKLHHTLNNQTKKILDVVDLVYQVENFHNTRPVVFLSDTANNKLPVIDMLSDFDTLKQNFDRVEKNKIRCYNIEISDGPILQMTCDAYSAGFETGIKGFDAEQPNAQGTSLSIANSFLNYIEKKSQKFSLIDKQKVFSTQKVIGDQTGYTLKTSFSLQLKYKNATLSL